MKKRSPANIDINLLPRDPFFSTPLGRILQWALSAGRYIVIFTELIVIMSFVARFTLDRQLTDLNTTITQKKNMIESYGNLEQDFRLAQKKTDNYKQVSSSINITEVFEDLSEVTPQDVEIDQLAIMKSNVTIVGSTLSQNSFNLLVNNLQLSSAFNNVSIEKIEAKEDLTPGFKFLISANTRLVAIEAPKAQEKTEKINPLDRTQGL